MSELARTVQEPAVEPTIDVSTVKEPTDTGHDYDGIREYDHPLPNWWLATLYGAIIFSFGYWMYYHVVSAGPLQTEAYELEMASLEAQRAERAQARGAMNDEALLAMAADPAQTAAGQTTYATYCVACHGLNGEGGIGPNLTDDRFLHGGKPTEILEVITTGVPAKGMAAWGPVLGAEKVSELAAFVVTLKGKNLPGKAPEGEIESE